MISRWGVKIRLFVYLALSPLSLFRSDYIIGWPHSLFGSGKDARNAGKIPAMVLNSLTWSPKTKLNNCIPSEQTVIPLLIRGGGTMRYFFIISIILAIMVTMGGCTQQQEDQEDMMSASYIDVSAAEAKDLIDNNPDIIVIDVSPNYAQGHLPGAVNYYIGDGSLDEAIPTLDKNATYLVYCHIDCVAIQGAHQLTDVGFQHVYRLVSDYSGWVDAGYPVEQ